MAMKAQDLTEAKIMTALTKGEIAAAVNLIIGSIDISGMTPDNQLILKVRLVRAFMFEQELRKGETNLNLDLEEANLWVSSGIQNN